MLIYEYKVGDSVKGEEVNSNDIKYQSLIGKGLKFQMQNIGAEVSRVIRFKNSNKMDRAESRLNTAIDMINAIKLDPINKNRIAELDFMIEELKDFVNGNKKYDINAESLLHQYDIFNDF